MNTARCEEARLEVGDVVTTLHGSFADGCTTGVVHNIKNGGVIVHTDVGTVLIMESQLVLAA